MKTLILYASRHGSSEKAANLLKTELKGEITLHNILKSKTPDITPFDAVIIGGSIHAGEVQRKIKSFCQNNTSLLAKKHLGLYLCCMEKEKAQMQFEKAYSEELRNAAISNGLFGGEFIFEKMNWIEKFITKKITGLQESKSDIDQKAIERFAEKMNKLPMQ